MDDLMVLVMLAHADATRKLEGTPKTTLAPLGWDGGQQTQIVRWIR